MLNCSKGSENTQMACALGRDMMIGAAGGASKAGLPGAAVGAGLAAVQNVSLRLQDHGPVNVAIPQVPMKPSHAEQNAERTLRADEQLPQIRPHRRARRGFKTNFFTGGQNHFVGGNQILDAAVIGGKLAGRQRGEPAAHAGLVKRLRRMASCRVHLQACAPAKRLKRCLPSYARQTG